MFEKIVGWGHQNITARNKSTFEITKESSLTKKGDCIIAVNASKGASELNLDFKQLAKQKDAKISVTIEVDGLIETAIGLGGPVLTFTHPSDLVARMSDFHCGRTFMIKSNKAAIDFSTEFITKIQSPNQKILITLITEINE